MTETATTSDILQRLQRTRAYAFGAISFGRLWPLMLPFLLVVGLYLSVSWFGVFRLVPDWTRIALAALFAVAALIALVPLIRFRRPSTAEIDRRIEQVNKLAHTPVRAQTDRLASEHDPFAEALWREHQRRAAAGLGRLAAGMPRTGVPERDPWGLRALVALLLVTAFAWSFGGGGGSITDPLRQHVAGAAVPPRIDAWVTPPAYTGKAPIFLTASANAGEPLFSVPAGSVVTLRATGADRVLELAFSDAGGAVTPVAAKNEIDPERPAAPQQFETELDRDGVLALRSGDEVIDDWSFAVIADLPPSIRFAGEPKRAVNGTLDIEYVIEDDYGAAGAATHFEQAAAPDEDAYPLYEAPEFPLRLPRRGADATATKASRDLTEHPWAGTEVVARLSATDDAGQQAFSEEKRFVLPERPFSNPLARAVIEQRRILALDANKKSRVLELMEAVTLRPEDTFKTMSHYLALVSAMARLKMARTDNELRDVVDYMWEIALGIEDGDLTAAEKRLRQAQEALRQALENGASDEEIERLMDELRAAMNEFLREFAERAMQDPNFSQQSVPPGQQMRQSDLQRMLDQIEELAKSGARNQAQELLSQLQDMMNNLQAGRQPGQQNGQGQGQMREQMNRLGEIMRRQQELMNETFRMDQMQRGGNGERGRQFGQGQGGRERGQSGQGGNRPGEGGSGGMTPDELAEVLRGLQQGQGQLQGDLGQLMEDLRGLGIKPDENFGEAGREMGKAGDALGDGNGEEALGNQGAAMEALRRGAQDMMNQMQQALGDAGGTQLGGQNRGDRDPLGRPKATTGPDFGDTVKIPDEIDVQRAREILEAIRKRLGNALSPAQEKQYLERLLELQ
ncbi:MAG: TIGR02302 family protein [Rhizobiaceae bacterium]